MSENLDYPKIFIDGVYHSETSISGDELLNNLYHQYIRNHVFGFRHNRKNEFANIDKKQIARISPQQNNAIIEAARLQLSHTLVIFCHKIGKDKKLRISAIPYLVRALPAHAMESYFCLRMIEENELKRLTRIPIGNFLSPDYLIYQNLPSNLMASSLVYQLIRQTISNENIIDLLDGLSAYKSRKLIAATGRFVPLSLFPTEKTQNRKKEVFSYLHDIKVLVQRPEIIDDILTNTSARSLEGISSFLEKNHLDSVRNLNFSSMDHIPKNSQTAFRLLSLNKPDRILNILGISELELSKVKNNDKGYKTIILLLIESSAWHRTSPQALQYLALYLRIYQNLELPKHTLRLLYDAISENEIKEIWRSTLPILNLKFILSALTSLQQLRSHELSLRYSSLICNKNIDEWYELINNPVGKGRTKNKIVENQLVVLAQCLHENSFDELRTVIKSVYLSEEIVQKVEKILYIRNSY